MKRAWLLAALLLTGAWQPSPWTPPIDNWGTGLAYRCDTPDCTATLYARTKVGFCNCFDGVADDDEIDRIGDVDLHGASYKPLAPGEITEIGALKGRKRQFTVPNRWFGNSYVLSIVVATDCKAVVATLVSAAPISPETERSALAVLTDKPFQHWAVQQ